MGNTDIVIEFLELHQPKPYCDDCISNETRIEPRQQVNQICNRLSNQGISIRRDVNCTICGKLKKCNVFIRREASSNPRGVNEASTQYSD